MMAHVPLTTRAALVMLLALVFVSAMGALGAMQDPASQSLLKRLTPPLGFGGVSEHILGADHLGRDMLARLVAALGTTLVIACAGVLLGAFAGVAMGITSAMMPGLVDGLLMMLIDAIAAVPLTLLALAMAALFVGLGGGSTIVLVFIVSLSDIDKFARVSRAQTLALRKRDFVEAARGLGAGPYGIAFRHILPNLASPIAVLASASLGTVITLESALSFLGVGVQPPAVSLGQMLGEARNYLITDPWMAALPAATIIILTVCVALVGDWLRDRLDPDLDLN